jgi:hypothetical protein
VAGLALFDGVSSAVAVLKGTGSAGSAQSVAATLNLRMTLAVTSDPVTCPPEAAVIQDHREGDQVRDIPPASMSRSSIRR